MGLDDYFLGLDSVEGYKDINGKSKIMASTQFESLDARRAFPCWDEPARKAESRTSAQRQPNGCVSFGVGPTKMVAALWFSLKKTSHMGYPERKNTS